MYYIKIALVTLIVSVGLAEFFGPKFGLKSYLLPVILPEVQHFIAQKKKEPTAPVNNDVSTLQLTSEKDKKFKPVVTSALSADEAFDKCYKAIKTISLFPEFTRIPKLNPIDSKKLFQFEWGSRTPVRTLSTRGADVGLSASCHINTLSGFISFFQLNDRVIAVKLDSDTVLGAWKVVRSVSEVDNSTNVSVSSIAKSSILLGNKKIQPELTIQCREDTTRFHVSFSQQIGEGDVDVSVGIDTRDPFNSQWTFTKDKSNIYPQEHHIGLIQLMLKGADLKIGFQYRSRQKIDLAFDLNHLRAAIYPLQTACHWK